IKTLKPETDQLCLDQKSLSSPPPFRALVVDIVGDCRNCNLQLITDIADIKINVAILCCKSRVAVS
ncbi:9414_t:CDS:1, partial [Entrophospora sp. SA101]